MFLMPRLRYIDELSADEVRKVFESIDYVFFDIDGVLVVDRTPIPGADDCVAKIRKLGKKVAFVSNNTIYPIPVIAKNVEPFGGTEDEIVTPNSALLAYLKKIDFKKDIYVIGCTYQKNLIRDAGYNVIEYKNITTEQTEETAGGVKELSRKVLEVCKNVGIVFVDLDFNVPFGSIQAATTILNLMKDVRYLTGVPDDYIPIDNNGLILIGPQFYNDGLKRWTNRDPVALAKPSLAFKKVLNSRFNISDDSRVLFIGDNLYTDIAFGINCGYKTCLVLSGATKESQIGPNLPKNVQPMYIAQNLGHLYEKIKHL